MIARYRVIRRGLLWYVERSYRGLTWLLGWDAYMPQGFPTADDAFRALMRYDATAAVYCDIVGKL